MEDPKFYFFIKNLAGAKFTERVGYINTGYTSRFDFALSFAGADRTWAERVFQELTDREFAVFYDKNEQGRMLATDLEEYLAPIYKSEATFVVCIMGNSYPDRIRTRFESRQFRSRFGAESVIPVWFNGEGPSAFDDAYKVGGYYFDRHGDPAAQVGYLGELLQAKLKETRLQPKLEPNTFLCRRCRLIHPLENLAPGTIALCHECSEENGPSIPLNRAR